MMVSEWWFITIFRGKSTISMSHFRKLYPLVSVATKNSGKLKKFRLGRLKNGYNTQYQRVTSFDNQTLPNHLHLQHPSAIKWTWKTFSMVRKKITERSSSGAGNRWMSWGPDGTISSIWQVKKPSLAHTLL